MKIRNWLLFALIGVSVAVGAIRPSHASTISFDVTFSAYNFFNLGIGTPVPSVLGHFGVTFDPSANVANSSNATLDFIDPLVMGSSVAFNYTAASGRLLIGGTVSGLNAVVGGNNDFMLEVLNFTSGSPTLSFLYYAQAATPGALFGSTTGSVQVATTPLPAALPLFVAALGGLGLAGWRRRKTAAA